MSSLEPENTRTRKPIRIGMIGYQFMGKAHTHAFRDVSYFFPEVTLQPVLQALAGRTEAPLRAAADRLGYASIETDWKALLERDDIDAIDICSPNYLHADMAIAAAKAGKHILCEKPLAMNVEEARAIVQAAEEAGIVHMVCHNYRFSPAVQFAKKLISEGRLGKIYHIRAQYLQDWIMNPDFPMVWRLKKQFTGSGAHGDIAAHIIDLARFLVGEFDSVVGMMETFIQERPSGRGDGTKESVDVDDASAFLARFQNGAMGVFEATRFAGGNRNGNRFEINGERGSIRWDLEHMNTLHVYLHGDEEGLQGFRAIHCTEAHHPFASAYWPSGHNIGYEHTFINLVKTWLDGIAAGVSSEPNLMDGLRNQAVLEAVERSAAEGRWISVDEVWK